MSKSYNYTTYKIDIITKKWYNYYRLYFILPVKFDGLLIRPYIFDKNFILKERKNYGYCDEN